MKVDVIGVPMDLGASKRGVDMGPSVIRYSGLKNHIMNLNIEYRDLGNINVPVLEEYTEKDLSRTKYIEVINQVNELLSNKVKSSLEKGNIPLVLGGDHSIAVGTVLGTQCFHKNIGVIWMDAHGDYNNAETTDTGNMHGMPLAACTGAGVPEMVGFKPENIAFINPKKVAIVGARSIDRGEAILLRKTGVNVFTMEDIDMHGMKEIMKKALDIVQNDTVGFHFSFDMDVITPSEAPGVGTPVKGGLTYREAHLAAEMVALSKKMLSMEFVELNPIFDNGNVTGELAISLITSVLGKRIYQK